MLRLTLTSPHFIFRIFQSGVAVTWTLAEMLSGTSISLLGTGRCSWEVKPLHVRLTDFGHSLPPRFGANCDRAATTYCGYMGIITLRHLSHCWRQNPLDCACLCVARPIL